MKASDIKRFMDKVKVNATTGCWEWQGGIATKTGYGRFWMGGDTISAHSASHLLFKGEVPKGLVVMHSCDNRCCVNPAHLSVGTYKDNLQDCIDKGRFPFQNPPVRKGISNGNSKLTENEVREIKRSTLSSIKLAAKYGVSKFCILSIRNGKTWRDVS